MFRVIKFENKSFKPALRSWLVSDKSQCHWPLKGLAFKLKNLVQPPNELNTEERKGWTLVKCEILPNGNGAISEILL